MAWNPNPHPNKHVLITRLAHFKTELSPLHPHLPHLNIFRSNPEATAKNIKKFAK